MSREYGRLSTMLYELTKPVGHSLNGDIEYYQNKCEQVSGRILEAGVGTGRVLIPFIQKGHLIDGLDSSKDMLAQCRRNLDIHQVQALLYEQDLLEMALPHRYDAIIMPAGTFCLIDKKRVKEVLSRFDQHLHPGGQVILDLEMPLSFEEGTTKTSRFPLTEDRELIFTSYSQAIDWLNQKTSSVNQYELFVKGKLVEEETAPFVIYWYGVEEFLMLLSSMNFQNIRYEVGYGKEGSEIVTFTASKGA